MVYFVIGSAKVNNSDPSTKSKVTNSVASYGVVTPVNIGQSRFKMGNLDNMMQNYETICKAESQSESVIRKIEKAYLDVNPQADISQLRVESRNQGSGKSEE